jgi:hypothetical protein
VENNYYHTLCDAKLDQTKSLALGVDQLLTKNIVFFKVGKLQFGVTSTNISVNTLLTHFTKDAFFEGV